MDTQEGRQFGHQAMLLSATHRSGLRRESFGGWEGKVWGQCRNKWRRRSCKLCLGWLVLICVCVCVQPIHLQSKPFMCLVVPEAFQDDYKHATSQVVLAVLFFPPCSLKQCDICHFGFLFSVSTQWLTTTICSQAATDCLAKVLPSQQPCGGWNRASQGPKSSIYSH